MATPEIQHGVQERPDEFKVPEDLESEIQAVETNAKANIMADKQGQPVIANSVNQPVNIQLPGDRVTLAQKAKGSINSAVTWFYRFLLRLWDKQKYANNNQ